MAVTSGTRLGPYAIVAPLGVGGMGEVYRAIDTNLDREVAINVLPASFALDADRVARFTREAKTLAALNHPNVAAIYGLEKTPDLAALVMELIEGEDLSSGIRTQRFRRPVPAEGQFARSIRVRLRSSTRDRPEKWTPAHASKAARASHLPGWLPAKKTAAFGSGLRYFCGLRSSAGSERWRGRSEGQKWGQCVPCKSMPVVYLAFFAR